jgi:hypothetical protein
MIRPTTMVAMWMKKSLQVCVAGCGAWTSSIGERTSDALRVVGAGLLPWRLAPEIHSIAGPRHYHAHLSHLALRLCKPDGAPAAILVFNDMRRNAKTN